MAEQAQVGCVVMFVQSLDRSVNFYADVLMLEVADRSPTAALLSNADGASLILRAMGRQAPHPLGSVGVQYVVWTAPELQPLTRGDDPPTDQATNTGHGPPRPRSTAAD